MVFLQNILLLPIIWDYRWAPFFVLEFLSYHKAFLKASERWALLVSKMRLLKSPILDSWSACAAMASTILSLFFILYYDWDSKMMCYETRGHFLICLMLPCILYWERIYCKKLCPIKVSFSTLLMDEKYFNYR